MEGQLEEGCQEDLVQWRKVSGFQGGYQGLGEERVDVKLSAMVRGLEELGY